MSLPFNDELRLSQEYKDRMTQPQAGHKMINIDFMPPADIFEDNNAYYIELELAGSSIENTLVRINDDNILVIEGRKVHRNMNTARKVIMRERANGNFSRAFQLPEEIDSFAIEANYYEGVLYLTVPKKEYHKDYEIAIN